VNHFFGRKKGGMAVATIGASAAFSTVCGSVVAAVSTMAAVAVPEMRKYKYDDGFAAGVTAIGASLAVVIPPSTAMVIYGILTEESIGQVLVGGFLPGIMTMIMLMLTVPIVLKFKPHLAPEAITEKMPFPWHKLKTIWAVPVIFVICIGGIYGGFFTPTEAGSVGAFFSLVFAIAIGRMNWQNFIESLKAAVRISSMTFVMIIGGSMFGAFLTRSRIPMQLIRFIEGLDVEPFWVVLVILIVYTALGPVMDEMATLVIMTPIIYPIIISLGYNGIWFGVMSMMMFLTGLLMPPVGVVSLVAASVTKIPSMKVFMSQWPFWITMLVACILIAAFPQITLFLPNLMYAR
jgi:tripartite ATP-independent transporter DctM subunit